MPFCSLDTSSHPNENAISQQNRVSRVPNSCPRAALLPDLTSKSVVSFFRAVLWIILIALHALCACFYGSSAYVYAKFESSALSIQLASYRLTIDPKHFQTIAVINGIFTICHLICPFEMAFRSVLARELIFHRQQKTERTPKQVSTPPPRSSFRSSFYRLKFQSFVTQASDLWGILLISLECLVWAADIFQHSFYCERHSSVFYNLFKHIR